MKTLHSVTLFINYILSTFLIQVLIMNFSQHKEGKKHLHYSTLIIKSQKSEKHLDSI